MERKRVTWITNGSMRKCEKKIQKKKTLTKPDTVGGQGTWQVFFCARVSVLEEEKKS